MPRVISDQLYQGLLNNLGEQKLKTVYNIFTDLGASKSLEDYVAASGKVLVSKNTNGQDEGVEVRTLTEEEKKKIAEDPTAQLEDASTSN